MNNNGFPNVNDNLDYGKESMEHETLDMTYMEKVLKNNKGKKANIYATFYNSHDWRDKVFSGIIEEAGSDHVTLSDPKTGKWYLLPIFHIVYIEVKERINY